MTRQAGRLRAVFDCNTLIQAAAFEGSAKDCMVLVDSGEVALFVSRLTLAELRRVLSYERVLALSPNMSAERSGAFWERVVFRSTMQRKVPKVFRYPRDPNDEPYIDLAVACKADYLVSRDNDLLSLMTGHSAVCKHFRRLAHPLRVVKPEAFLAAVAERGQ